MLWRKEALLFPVFLIFLPAPPQATEIPCEPSSLQGGPGKCPYVTRNREDISPSPTSSSFMAAFLIYKYISSLYLSNRYLKLDRACAASTLSCPLCIYRYVFIFLWLQNINLTPPICLSISSSSSFVSTSSSTSCFPAVFPMAAH